MKDSQVFSVDRAWLPEATTQPSYDGNNVCKAHVLVSALKQEKDKVLEKEGSIQPASLEAQVTIIEPKFQTSQTPEAYDASPAKTKSIFLESKAQGTTYSEEARSSLENASTNTNDVELGLLPFSGALSFAEAIPYSGPIAYSGPILYSRNISRRSDASSASAQSFAFPVLPHEWNNSPARMEPVDLKYSRRRNRSWLCCFGFCSRSSTHQR